MASTDIVVRDVETAFSVGASELENGEEFYNLKLPESTTPILSWKNLRVAALVKSNNYLHHLEAYLGLDSESKHPIGDTILNNVSGQILGGFHGVLGPSGSGKTSLLNALSLRLDPVRTSVTGELFLNGKPYSVQTLKNAAAYVMQDDVLHAEFTVLETISYHASLRLSGELDGPARSERVEELLALLGIDHRKHVIVGDDRNKGISGGERKRLCIAVELLTRPQLLFLDEPTSGLDSETSFDLMQALARLTEENKLTVLATVHQPRKKLFDLFHNVTLMQSGDVVYQGHTRGAVRYFASAGYPSLGQGNPADHILDVLATTEISSGKKVPRLQREVDLSLGADYPDLPVRKKTRWIEQFYILFRRAVHQNVRNWHLHLANFICVILVTFFVGYGPWDHIPPTPEKVGLYPAVLFYCAIHQGLVYSYQGINAFPRERAIMIRERQNGAYQVSTYFLSKTLADSIFQLPSPIVFSLLVYHQVGLQDTAHKFGTFIWLLILTAQAAVAMTNMISCIFLSIESTVVVIAISFEITRLFGGWFVPPILITSQYSAWKFQDALSYLKYGFIGISLNQYRGLNLLCTPAQLANPKVICTGEQYLATFGLEQYTVSECAGYLIVLILGFRLLSYLALRFIKL